MEENEISIFEYLPKVLPILDVIFIVWIAFNSPQPWITTPIHIAMPVFGFSALVLFKKYKKIHFYLIGIATGIPVFFLNCWGNIVCPTWLTEFSFIAGGLLLTKNVWERLFVLGFVFATTILPLSMNNNSWQFITTILIAEIAIWFLLERSVNFMEMQSLQIRKQKELVETKQKEILDSIHYAKRIQKSLMPTEKYIDKNLKQLKK